MFSRGGSQPLYGEVGDGMEGQIDQLTPEVVLVEVTENGFVGQLCDGFNKTTGGLVLEEDQKRTGKKKEKKRKSDSYRTFHVIPEQNGTRVVSDLTPGAALRLDRYSMVRLSSCLQSLGRFL